MVWCKAWLPRGLATVAKVWLAVAPLPALLSGTLIGSITMEVTWPRWL